MTKTVLTLVRVLSRMVKVVMGVLGHDHIDEHGDAEFESNEAAAAKPESNTEKTCTSSYHHLRPLTGTKPYPTAQDNNHELSLNGSYLISGA